MSRHRTRASQRSLALLAVVGVGTDHGGEPGPGGVAFLGPGSDTDGPILA